MRQQLKRLIILGLLGAVLALALPTLAQVGGGFTLTWSTIDGGGGSSTGSSAGAAYAISGTMGQPDAGLLEGGGYALSGGFWTSGTAVSPASDYQIYLPVIIR